MMTAETQNSQLSRPAQTLSHPSHPTQGLFFPVIHSNTSTFTIMMDAQFFTQHPHWGYNPANWTPPTFRVFHPETGPNLLIYLYIHDHSLSCRAIACQFQIGDYDVPSAFRLIKARHNDWMEEVASRLGLSWTSVDHQFIASGFMDPSFNTLQLSLNTSSPSSSLPLKEKDSTVSLFSLLTKLGQPGVTSVEQKRVIRRLVTDYLNHETFSQRLFSFLVQVVGWHTMCLAIKSLKISLTNQTEQSSQEDISSHNDICRDAKPKIPSPRGLDIYLPGSCRFFLTFHPYQSTPFNVSPQHVALLVKYFIQYMAWFLPNLFWIHQKTFGERIVSLSHKAFILGGIHLHQLHDNFEDCVPTFQQFQVLNLHTLTFDKTTSSCCSRNCPPSLMYHSMHTVFLASAGPTILVHGGLHLGTKSRSLVMSPLSSCETPTTTTTRSKDQVLLNDRLFAYNLLSNSWTLLDSNSPQRPSPRHSHASAVYPAIQNSHSQYLIIFGGVGRKEWEQPFSFHTDVSYSLSAFQALIPVASDDLEPLNDLWLFNFESKQWHCIVLPISPCPRFGLSFAWATLNTLLLVAGETRSEYFPNHHQEVNAFHRFRGTPPGPPILLKDCWTLHCPSDAQEMDTTPCKKLFEWNQLKDLTCPLAHYAMTSLTFCLHPTNADLTIFQPVMAQKGSPGEKKKNSFQLKSVQESKQMFQQIIFLISGTTIKDNILEDTPLIFLGLVFVSETDSIDVMWLDTDAPTVSDHETRFIPRRGHSALPFHARPEEPGDTLIRSELHQAAIFPLTNYNYETEDFPDSYLSSKVSASVPCIFVTRGFQTHDGRLVSAAVLNLSKLYPNFSGAARRMSPHRQILANLLLFGPQLLTCLPQLASLDNDASENDDTLVTTHLNPLVKPTGLPRQWIKKINLLYRDLQSLSFFKPPHFVGGSCSKFLKRLRKFCNHSFTAFGHLLENASNSRVQATSINVQFHRWRNTNAISVTDDGVGLSHTTLHTLLKSYGGNSEKFDYYGKVNQLTLLFHALCFLDPAKFGLGFKFSASVLCENCLVLTRTPWRVGVGLLSSVLQTLFPSSRFSTPIIFWCTLTGVPLSLRFQEADVTRYLHLLFTNTPINTMAALNEEFENLRKGTRFIFWNLHPDIPKLQPNGRFMQPSLGTYNPQSDSLPPSQNFSIQKEFPLFSNIKDSLDHSLATYMFWVNLHCSPTLYLNGVPLLPSSSEDENKNKDMNNSPQSQASDHTQDDKTRDSPFRVLFPSGVKVPRSTRYINSLWTFLQTRLYHKLELPYLLTPEDGDRNGYALIGFLNNPESKGPPKLHETGILLYYDGRLINRAVHSIPTYHFHRSSSVFGFLLTAVINVPNCFLPKPTKEEFSDEGHTTLHNFYDQLEEILHEYLQVHHSKTKLQTLQRRYMERFDKYREITWTKRTRKVFLEESIHSTSPNTSPVEDFYQDDVMANSRAIGDQRSSLDEHSTSSSEKAPQVWRKRKRRYLPAQQKDNTGTLTPVGSTTLIHSSEIILESPTSVAMQSEVDQTSSNEKETE